MSQARALIWVQHLLGIGHLRRAASLARALAEEALGAAKGHLESLEELTRQPL